jgi:FtsH-binding integral membrane protein
VITWMTASLVGIAGGVFIASRSRFIVDPIARTVMLPGSPLPLLMMIAIFITKFWLGFEMATVTNASSLGNYVLIGAAVSGVVAGMFTGRFITYWRAMNARRVVRTYSRSA